MLFIILYADPGLMNVHRMSALIQYGGKTFFGKIFIDATYEGDLMASAGVSYNTGREGCTVYNEDTNF